MSKILSVCVGGLLLSATSILPADAQTTVAVADAWARATPATAENGAAYLTLRAAAADRLTGVTTPVAKTAELHSMTMEGSIMKMRQVEAIELPPGQPVTLKPGGLHIMLHGLVKPLRPGEAIPLTLHFAKAGTAEVNVPVEAIGATGPTAASSHHDIPMPAHH